MPGIQSLIGLLSISSNIDSRMMIYPQYVCCCLEWRNTLIQLATLVGGEKGGPVWCVGCVISQEIFVREWLRILLYLWKLPCIWWLGDHHWWSIHDVDIVSCHSVFTCSYVEQEIKGSLQEPEMTSLKMLHTGEISSWEMKVQILHPKLWHSGVLEIRRGS